MTRRDAYSPERSFGVGVEEELLLIDELQQAARCPDSLLSAASCEAGRATGEVHDSIIELVSNVCVNAVDARSALRQLRAKAAENAPGHLIGSGVHPDGTASRGHRGGDRYNRLQRSLRAVLRQTPQCGLHVHVGLPDPETAVRASNGMRQWIPLLVALGANSPCWYGEDSGFASARRLVNAMFPRSGPPPYFADYSDFHETIRQLELAGDAPDETYVWWDVRLSPSHGTLEVRCIDSQSSLDDLAALVALVHGLVLHEALDADAPAVKQEILEENCFLAARDGIDATLTLHGRRRTVAELAEAAVAAAAPHAAALGASAELADIWRLLADGNGAVRQRRELRCGGMPSLLESLKAETLRGLEPSGGGAAAELAV